MALETLKDIAEIDGYKLIDLEEAQRDRQFINIHGFDWNKFDEYRKSFPISIAKNVNMISFRIQDGPIKENGVNGCQIDTIIETAKIIIEELNNKFPCRENACAITKLDEALMWLNKRKQDRVKRGVEGLNKK